MIVKIKIIEKIGTKIKANVYQLNKIRISFKQNFAQDIAIIVLTIRMHKWEMATRLEDCLENGHLAD
jgi:hypothetical protein